jgi:20S proteasome alpha/beta subunit
MCPVTVVVGVVGRKGVLLAGDSQASTSYSNRKYAEAKTFSISEVLAVAYCGSGRLGQVLIHHLDELDDPPLGRDEMRWMVRDFIPFLRDVTEQAGHLHIHHNVEHLGESAFLMGVRGRLFTVDADMSVSEHVLPFDALGSGEDAAIGAMHALAGDDREPLTEGKMQSVAEAGVAAATTFTNFVGGDMSTARTVAITAEEKAAIRKLL